MHNSTPRCPVPPNPPQTDLIISRRNGPQIKYFNPALFVLDVLDVKISVGYPRGVNRQFLRFFIVITLGLFA
jgi:hypothetical protein